MTAPTPPTTPPPPPPGTPPMPMPKATVLLNLLEGDRDVDIHLDPRRPGTLVPCRYQREVSLTLKVGNAMAKPIPDLTVEDDGVGATLSFGGRTEWCFIPWHSVYGMSCTIGSVVWPEDLPPELEVRPAGAAPAGAPATKVIDLMARRTPKDRRACERRLAARAKLTAPSAAAQPEPDGAA